MRYKAGDEVLIKGEVIEVMNDVPYPVRVRLGSDNGGLVFTNDEVCYADKIVKTYEMGLKDAWELAKKIGQMDCIHLDVIFGSDEESVWNHTYEEALAKIEAYEFMQRIQEGDVVEASNGLKGVVVKILPGGGLNIIHENGLFSADCPDVKYKKTGKHLEIAELLRQIGE